MLEYHQIRVNRTFHEFWPDQEPLELSEILRAPYSPVKTKVRLVYSQNGYEISHAGYKPKHIETVALVETAMEYSFKFEDRGELNSMLATSGTDEIIIVKDGFVSDSSYSNIVCYDGSNWWTPKKPLLEGTRRAALIESGKIDTADIRPTDLPAFEKICLINAMLGLEELHISGLIG